jgi:TRAP-type mannitol/chloroaromatic compound transport system substrate-binding protein
MKRRDFMKSTAVAIAGAASLGVPATVNAASKNWKLVTSLPKGLPGPGVSADRFAKRVTDMSDGRLSIKVFSAGELVPPFGTQEAVENGIAEIYHGSGSWFAGRDKAHSFFSVVPFGLDYCEFNAWLNYGGGQKLWDDFTLPRGLKCFNAGGSGVQTFGWFKKEIKSLSDMQGLNFRITGFGAQVMRKIGVNPVSIPPSEIFPALQSGSLDAAEWVGPNNDLAFGFHKIMTHMYTPSFSDIHGGMEFGINKKAWDSLDKDLQLIIEVAAEAETNILFADGFYGNILALEKIKSMKEITIGQLPDSVWDALRKASKEVMNEAREGNKTVADIQDSFFAFAKIASSYRLSYETPLYIERSKYYA